VVSGHFHTQIAVQQGKQDTLPIWEETAWILQPICVWWRKENPYHITKGLTVASRVYNFRTQAIRRSTYLRSEIFLCSNNAVGIATDCGLEDREDGVQVPVGTRFFSSSRRPDRFRGPLSLLSYWKRGHFPECKADAEWSWPVTSN
jgi:hypothetical protein